MWSALTDSYTNTPMAITAENLAEKYNITREQCDEYALRSQTAWGTAHKEGRFKAEIEPIEVFPIPFSLSFSIELILNDVLC